MNICERLLKGTDGSENMVNAGLSFSAWFQWAAALINFEIEWWGK